MRYLIPSLLLIGTLSGCDIIDTPKATIGPDTGPGGGVTRNVLLEDCTGHLCNNCPDAAIRAQQLKAIYGERLVVVGVHMVNSFAQPQSPNYTTDFRTPAGSDYEQTFQITSLPTGMISRKPLNGSIRISRYSWSTAVADLIDQTADIDLQVDTIQYDAGTNTVSGTVRGIILNPFSGPQNITLYITEDHVIDWQLDNSATPPDVPNYDHRDVLRAALNGSWGQAFANATDQVGDTIDLPFSYQLPSNVLQPANCALVAYVYSTTGADQYEVKQVVERKLVE
ncbi:MAG: Omp28 family outer membrane lipoprotein [Flavobacteriales bacterium]|nr:Omp28 family outer membrane lipoprotein [Flavobacteriales bacterium]